MKTLQSILIALFFVSFLGAASISAQSNPPGSPVPTVMPPSSELEDLLNKAFELFKQKKYDEALAICTNASASYPNDYRPHLTAGVIYRAQLKTKEASESFAKAISLQPNNKALYLLKANVDAIRGETEKALAACRKALEIDPTFANAYMMIGYILRIDEKRRDEAIAAYRMAIKVDPSLPEPYEILAQIFEAAGDEKRLEELLREQVAANPKHMAVRFKLGRILVKQGQLTEARALWEGRTSDEDNTYPNFITVLERAEKLKQATEALAAKPGDPDTLVRMGNAVMEGDSWVADNRQERAIVYFTKALKLRPKFAIAQYGICKAYIQLASSFKDKNKNVDAELAKLRRLDAKLATEMEEYRKTYTGGFRSVGPLKSNR